MFSGSTFLLVVLPISWDVDVCYGSQITGNPEILISPKVRHIPSKFQWRTYGIRPWQTCRKCTIGNSNNDRQSEMAAKTGDAYVSETMKGTVKIPVTNLGIRPCTGGKQCWQVSTTATDNRKYRYGSQNRK